ncbi:MAG: T9SS type A sorting domain-containing protein [Flavobacteriales bacterium]|nr:T9SS type A sorting domain-containing protein [Flavobacteriales bacterium]
MRAHYALSLLLSLSAMGAMAQPANDACANALPISCGNLYNGTTVAATNDIALNCGTNVTAPGVWYLLQGSNEQIIINTCVGTTWDTRLNVYTGSCGNFTCVTGNDDACDYQSLVSFVAVEGVSYYVLVQGYNGATGAFQLLVDCGPITEDNCLGALPIACGQTVNGNTIGATIDGAPECDTEIQAAGEWYTFSGVEAQVTLSTCPGSGYDTRLNVYRGSCAELVCVVGNDDAPDVLCSEVIFDATANETYYVLVQGYNGQVGGYELRMTCNNCPAPTNVSVNALDTNAEVAWDSGVEGTPFFVEYGPSGFTPGTGTVISGITGTDGPPVYFDGLELGTAYQVYITQSCGKEESTTGPIGFITLSEALAPNAGCNGAIAIACGQSVQGNTTLGLQADAPTCGSANISTRGLWYTFSGTGEVVTLSTCGNTTYDSKISVFTGSCGAFTCVAGNDDAPGCTGNSSEAIFPSTNGTTYFVYVHGYNDAQGDFSLAMSCAPGCTPVANDDCATATVIDIQPIGGCEASTGTTVCAFAPALPNPPCDPFAPINDVWYTFNSGWANSFDILLQTVGAATINAALYNACNGEYITCWMDVTDAINVSGAPANTDLYLRLWNGGGEEAGSFTLCVEADITTGVQGTTTATTQLWPSPATTTLSVRPTTGLKQLQVLDAQGRLVDVHGVNGSAQTTISVEHLVPGIYLLRADNGTLLGRFVKE